MVERRQRWSEDRLEALPDGSWTPAQFHQAAERFRQERGLTVALIRRGDDLPPMRDRAFKYPVYGEIPEEWDDGNDVVVAVVLARNRLVGYATAVPGEIKIVDVHREFLRSSGVQLPIEVAGQSFAVGIGHVLVSKLIGSLDPPLTVDATTPPSRFIFKSLGFRHRESTGNPCILDYP